MESAKSENGNGGVKLPIGFRFHPTDQELVVHYLKRKVFSLPLPASIIPESEVFQSNPWDLPGDLKEKRYFFCKKSWNFVKKCSGFSTDCGYWKVSGKEKQIMAPGSNLVIGIKKSFVFHEGRKFPGLRTQWIMHEFCLVGSVKTPYSTQRLMMPVGDWVVCRLYQRKRKSRNHGTIDQLANSKKSRNLMGIVARDRMNLRIGGDDELGLSFARSSPFSSCSSGITEISSNELDQEASSHSISF